MPWDRAQPAPLALWRIIHANFPQTRNLGIYNPRNIAGTRTPSLHSEGRALDIGLSANVPRERTIGDLLFRDFAELGVQMQLQEVIWNQQIWSDARRHIHAYTGANPHTDHIHVGFTRAGSQQTDFPLMMVRVGIIFTGLGELDSAMGTVG